MKSGNGDIMIGSGEFQQTTILGMFRCDEIQISTVGEVSKISIVNPVFEPSPSVQFELDKRWAGLPDGVHSPLHTGEVEEKK